MSLLLLVDGYNVVAPVAPPAGRADPKWLQRERMQLLQRLVEFLDAETRSRTCVVFDAANPPPDRPDQFQFHGIEVRFAIDYPEADDLLEELIAAHSAPKTLAVVSSDHRVQAFAKRRGSLALDSQAWLDDLLESRVILAVRPKRKEQGNRDDEDRKPPQKNDDQDVEGWMREFGF
ncbi:MAG: NYN domain-containing protein [Rubripirellula sp.]